MSTYLVDGRKDKNKAKRPYKPRAKWLVITNAFGLVGQNLKPTDRNRSNVCAWLQIMLHRPGLPDSQQFFVQELYYVNTHNNIVVKLPLEVEIQPLLGAHCPAVFLKDGHSGTTPCIYEYKVEEFRGKPPTPQWACFQPDYFSAEELAAIPIRRPYPTPKNGWRSLSGQEGDIYPPPSVRQWAKVITMATSISRDPLPANQATQTKEDVPFPVTEDPEQGVKLESKDDDATRYTSTKQEPTDVTLPVKEEPTDIVLPVKEEEPDPDYLIQQYWKLQQRRDNLEGETDNNDTVSVSPNPPPLRVKEETQDDSVLLCPQVSRQDVDTKNAFPTEFRQESQDSLAAAYQLLEQKRRHLISSPTEETTYTQVKSEHSSENEALFIKPEPIDPSLDNLLPQVKKEEPDTLLNIMDAGDNSGTMADFSGVGSSRKRKRPCASDLIDDDEQLDVAVKQESPFVNSTSLRHLSQLGNPAVLPLRRSPPLNWQPLRSDGPQATNFSSNGMGAFSDSLASRSPVSGPGSFPQPSYVVPVKSEPSETTPWSLFPQSGQRSKDPRQRP